MITALKALHARLRAFFTTRDLDDDFEQELASHLTMLTEDNVRRGLTPDQARRAALIRMGGPVSIKEQHRGIRGLPAVEAVLQDLRFAFRLIAKEPRFSAAAVLALALGIGINAIGFTVVNAAFLRGLPVEDAGRLYTLSWKSGLGRRVNVSHAELQDWREQSHTFAGFAAFSDATMNISDDRALPEQVQGSRVTANTFGVLRLQPLLGRDFAPGDDRTGAEPVVIIGYGIWKNRYGADPNVVGASLRVNGQPATIIGIMPERMKFPDSTELWIPSVPGEARRNVRPLIVFGRLRDGSSRPEAQSELNVIAQRLAATFPDTNKDLGAISVETFTERFIGGKARTMFLAMMGAVGFVLLIACANVANLLLSRSAHRAHEIAIRMALGATRWRVIRQLLLESVVLAFIGGSIGLLLAVAGVGMFETAMQDSGKPFWLVFTVDYVVIAYAAAICVLTAVLSGLAPALHVSKTNQNDVLKEGGRGTAGSVRARWFTGTMVVAELALTVILLAGAGLMIRSFIKVSSIDIGVGIDQLITMRMQLPESRYATPETRRAFFERLELRLAAIPGVELAAVTTGVPPLDGGERLLEIDRRAGSQEPATFVSTVTISPRFFGVVGVPLVRGRNFKDLDGAPGSEAVIINERLATQFFRGEDPIGRRLRFTQRETTPGKSPDGWRTIVGISGRILHGSPEDAYLNFVVYIPYRQESPAAASLLVRSTLAPGIVMDAVRREVQAIDRDQPVFAIQTVAQMMVADRWPLRAFGGMFALFAVVALVLSSVGLYALVAYSVTQRTQEIGVRMALGAERRQVSWMILRLGLIRLALGLTFGLAGALALSGVIRRTLVGITPSDPVTFAAITLLLAVVSIAACLLPARRATRVDPVVALRAE